MKSIQSYMWTQICTIFDYTTLLIKIKRLIWISDQSKDNNQGHFKHFNLFSSSIKSISQGMLLQLFYTKRLLQSTNQQVAQISVILERYNLALLVASFNRWINSRSILKASSMFTSSAKSRSRFIDISLAI